MWQVMLSFIPEIFFCCREEADRAEEARQRIKIREADAEARVAAAEARTAAAEDEQERLRCVSHLCSVDSGKDST